MPTPTSHYQQPTLHILCTKLHDTWVLNQFLSYLWNWQFRLPQRQWWDGTIMSFGTWRCADRWQVPEVSKHRGTFILLGLPGFWRQRHHNLSKRQTPLNHQYSPMSRKTGISLTHTHKHIYTYTHTHTHTQKNIYIYTHTYGTTAPFGLQDGRQRKSTNMPPKAATFPWFL
jgi:hypothetical protein